MKSVLITAFEPFGGEALNASWEAVRLLDGETIAGHRVVARLLPCVFGASIDAAVAAIEEVSPALVLAVGQASNRDAICIERVAINLDDARIADNRGQMPVDAAIVEDGPAAHFSSLPSKRMVAQIEAAGIAAKLSETAGTYVCNHVFYGIMHYLATNEPALRAGFIHVPSLERMPAETIAEGLRCAVRAALTLA